MKRATLVVADEGELLQCRRLTRELAKRGLDVKLVTKHAIQVHPDQLAKAIEIGLEEKLLRKV